jgi:hypothetical protein
VGFEVDVGPSEGAVEGVITGEDVCFDGASVTLLVINDVTGDVVGGYGPVVVFELDTSVGTLGATTATVEGDVWPQTLVESKSSSMHLSSTEMRLRVRKQASSIRSDRP